MSIALLLLSKVSIVKKLEFFDCGLSIPFTVKVILPLELNAAA